MGCPRPPAGRDTGKVWLEQGAGLLGLARELCPSRAAPKEALSGGLRKQQGSCRWRVRDFSRGVMGWGRGEDDAYRGQRDDTCIRVENATPASAVGQGESNREHRKPGPCSHVEQGD